MAERRYCVRIEGLISRTTDEQLATGLPKQSIEDVTSAGPVQAIFGPRMGSNPIPYLSNANFTSAANQGFPFWSGSEDQYKSGKIQFATEKSSSKNFLREKVSGDIVVHPYAVGKLTWHSHSKAVLPLRPWSVKTNGWYSWYTVGCPQFSFNNGTCSALRFIYECYTVASYSGVLDLGTAVDEPFWDTLRAAPDTGLVTEAVADANSGFWDALTEVVEAPETFKYMKDKLSHILDVTESHSRETERKAMKLAPFKRVKFVASMWMQYRYAIMPLLYSVQDVSELLSHLQVDFLTTRSKKSGTGAGYKTAIGNLYADYEDKVMIKRCYAGLDETKKLYEFVKLNPITTIYEVMPYSFVLDWVLNIGDFLSAALDPDTYLKQACTYSRKWASSGTLKTQEYGDLTIAFSTYDRIIINPADHIGLDVDVDINWKRKLDSLALAFNEISRRSNTIRRSLK